MSRISIGKSIWNTELDSRFVAVIGVVAIIAMAAIVQILQPGLPSGEWAERTLLFSVIYTVLFWVIFSGVPWFSASLWLGIPVLLFLATWLKSQWAWPLTCLVLISLLKSIRENYGTLHWNRFDALPGALLILFWVSMSGAGGYGFQNSDYVLHNGRLIDLIENSWPVSYQQGVVLTRPEHANKHLLVLYSGYYILAALVGKISSVQAAMGFMHCWTLAGCWVALRFLQKFSNMRNATLPAVLMIGGGGWDLGGLFGAWLLQGVQVSWNIVFAGLQQLWHSAATPVWLDFWAGDFLVEKYHFGNFLSLTAELFWAPHHTIAGWLSVALLYEAWKKQNYAFVGFNGALLMYFSPLMSVVVLPFILVMLLNSWMSQWKKWVSLPNITGVLIATILFLYYWSGSVATNPVGIILLKAPWASSIGFLVYFYFFSWGIYALACIKHIKSMSIEKKLFFATMFFLFFMLPIFRYGLWNDLMVRASGLLYFCVVVLLLDVIRIEILAGHRLKLILFLLLSVPSWPSAIFNLHASMANIGHQEPAQRVVDYWDGWEELGELNSLYVRYFSAPLSKFPNGATSK